MANVCVSCPAPPRRRAYRRAPARRARRRAAPRRRRQRRTTGPHGHWNQLRTMAASRPRLTRYELAQINPFDKRVIGVKIPDSNTQPSDTFRSEDRFTFTTNASSFAVANAYLPNLVAAQVASTVASTTAWTWPAAYGGVTASNVAADANNSFAGVRPCGHGVRLSCPLAPTATTGFVHIAIYPLATYSKSTWILPLSLNEMANLPWYRRFTLAQLTQQSVTIVNKFLDSTATRYSAPNSDLADSGTDISFQFSGGWCAILIAVEAAPASTTCLSAESIVHYEALPLNSSTNTGSYSPAANFDVQELEAVSRIATTVPGVFVEGQEQSVIQQGIAALSSGMGAAAGEIYNSAVLPAARGLGYAATYAAYGAAAGYGARFGGMPGINTPRLLN